RRTGWGRGEGWAAKPPDRSSSPEKIPPRGSVFCAGGPRGPRRPPRQRPPRPPPPPGRPPPRGPPGPRPPPEPGVRGFETLTVIFRPSSSLPLSSAMARWASSAVDISMNPKPRDWPENLSVMTEADSTVPHWEKYSRRVSPVVE